MKRKNCRVTPPMIGRMKELRSLGLSSEAVARLIEHEYGTKPDPATVTKYAPMNRTFESRRGIAGVA